MNQSPKLPDYMMVNLKLSNRERRYFRWSLGFAFTLFVTMLIMPVIAYNFHVINQNQTPAMTMALEQLGTYGDMFGVCTSLFTGLGLIGLIYTSILGRRQLEVANHQTYYQMRQYAILMQQRRSDLAKLHVGSKDSVDFVPQTQFRDAQDFPVMGAYAKIKVFNVRGAYAKDCRAYLYQIDRFVDDDYFYCFEALTHYKLI